VSLAIIEVNCSLNIYLLYPCRVGISLGLLAGSKLLTVCVPFLFKGAVDTMTTLNMDTAPDAVLSTATALMLGCKSIYQPMYQNKS